MKYITYTMMVVFSLSLIIGCSNTSRDPINMDVSMDTSSFPVPETETGNIDRSFLGSWTLIFNPDTLDYTLNTNRESAAHFNAKQLIPSPIVQVISYDPVRGIMDLDITLSNPYTVNCYDVRLIIYTDNLGVRLLNSDAWTALFDIPGGSQINPFKAYAKNEPNHKFKGLNSYTERVQCYLPPSAMNLAFAIDASYPTNCTEPYSIENFKQVDNLTEGVGASALVKVDVLDWQEDVNSVSLYCPLITGVTLLPFNQINSKTWEATIINNEGASRGDYVGYIYTTSSNSGTVALYDDVLITIKEETGWARTWGSTGTDYGDDVAVDEAGNIFVGGGFGYTVDFDPGPNTAIKTTNGEIDTYLCKYDRNGNFQWVVTWGNSVSAAVYGITSDHAGNVLIAGFFEGTLDFDPGPGQDIHSSNGEREAFVSKFDTNGNYMWGRGWGGSSTDGINAITVDNLNNVYAAGYFCGTVNFNPRGLADNRSSNGSFDASLTKILPGGEYAWTLTWGGFNQDFCTDLMVNGNGDIFICGDFENIVDFDPGTQNQLRSSNGQLDCFLSKFDSNGIFQWVNTWGGVGIDDCYCLNLDISENVLVGGNFENSLDFDPGDNTLFLSSYGELDSYVSKFDSDGNFIWVRSWGGIAGENVYEIGTDSMNNVYVTGVWRLSVDFNPDSDPEIRTSAGDFDIYLKKMDSDGEFVWVQTWGGVSNDQPIGMSRDCSNSIYVVGMFSNQYDFDPGPDTDVHISNGVIDAFLMKVLPNGYWE